MGIHKNTILGCIENNSTCQEQVYKYYYGYMLAIGHRYIQDVNDVRLIINESFFKAFSKISQYDISIPFEIWIRRIMINTCIDFLRKYKKEKFTISVSQEQEVFLPTSSNSFNYAEANIETAYLEKLLENVPDTSRKVFYLFAIEGYSHKEIAAQLEINEGTSKWHVNNARKLLKEQLMEYVKKTKKDNVVEKTNKLNIV